MGEGAKGWRGGWGERRGGRERELVDRMEIVEVDSRSATYGPRTSQCLAQIGLVAPTGELRKNGTQHRRGMGISIYAWVV